MADQVVFANYLAEVTAAGERLKRLERRNYANLATLVDAGDLFHAQNRDRQVLVGEG